MNRRYAHVDFRPEPVHPIARTNEHRGQVRAAIVAHLPRCISGETHVDEARDPDAESALDLYRVAARDIDRELA